MDFIYERVRLPFGAKLETVTGGSRYSGRVWEQIAKQIYCENGKDDYRDLGHFPSGAPFIYGADERISISHTAGCLAVATIATAPEAVLSEFSPQTALGIDVERADREKVVGMRERFLTEEELGIVPAGSVEANVLAWTCKEALLKAAMKPDIDWLRSITILRLPEIEPDIEHTGSERGITPGQGCVTIGDVSATFTLHSYRFGDFIITIAR